jgi:hypothetical protein
LPSCLHSKAEVTSAPYILTLLLTTLSVCIPATMTLDDLHALACGIPVSDEHVPDKGASQQPPEPFQEIASRNQDFDDPVTLEMRNMMKVTEEPTHSMETRSKRNPNNRKYYQDSIEPDDPPGTMPWYLGIMEQALGGIHCMPNDEKGLPKFINACVGDDGDASDFGKKLQNCEELICEDFFPKEWNPDDYESIEESEEAFGNAARQNFTEEMIPYLKDKGRFDSDERLVSFEDDDDVVWTSLDELIAALFCVCGYIKDFDVNTLGEGEVVACQVCAASGKQFCDCTVCLDCKNAGLSECAPGCTNLDDINGSESEPESDEDYDPEAPDSEASRSRSRSPSPSFDEISEASTSTEDGETDEEGEEEVSSN